MNFHYTTIEEHQSESALLNERFELSRTIAGTHRLHSFRPLSINELEVREFSSSSKIRVECVSSGTKVSDNVSTFSVIRGYVTARYDDLWWLACVTKSLPDSEEVEISFLHPHGPAKSFNYPSGDDVLVMSYHDVLTLVNPLTATDQNLRTLGT